MPEYTEGKSSSLSAPKRFITTHDDNGKAVLYAPSADSEDVKLKYASPAAWHIHYTTEGFPVQLNGDKDLTAFMNRSAAETIANKNGSVIRMVDLEPGAQSPMHRTLSLDYGIVLAGEIDLVLEDWDGPVRRMKPGDVSVQRGTMHAWRNASQDEWVRMMYILIPAEPLELGGQKLTEELGDIEIPK